MKKKTAKSQKQIELSSECDFRDVDAAELKACCLYEYFRESGALRRSFAPRQHTQSFRISATRAGFVEVSEKDQHERLHWQTVIHPDSGLAVPAGVNQAGLPVLAYVLIKARWQEAAKRNKPPLPWKSLQPKIKEEFVDWIQVYLATKSKDQKRYQPLLVEEFLPGHDPVELEQQFEKWKEHAYYSAAPGREYFFGLLRLDGTYNGTEMVKAFGAWFRERYSKTKGGGGGWRQWQAKLNDLVVMRLCKHFLHALVKRIQHVAELTTSGFKACKDCVKPRTADRPRVVQNSRAAADEEDALSKRIEEISVNLSKAEERDRRMRKAATQEMNRACADALKFFESLFPDEKPLSY